MKIPALRKRITINFSASGILLIILGAIIAFNIMETSSLENKINKIKGDTESLHNQIQDLENKTSEGKKYKAIWEKLPALKKNLDGIKMDEINDKISSLTAKYSIPSHDLKVTVPESLKDGIFKRDTIGVLFTTVNLSYKAYDDVSAIYFMNDFLSSLPGYSVITNFEIKKDKDYTTEDLVQISSGKSLGTITAKLDFYWYTYKDLENNKKPANNTLSGIATANIGGEDASEQTP